MKKSSVFTDYIVVMTVGIGTMCGVEVCTIAPKLIDTRGGIVQPPCYRVG
jgi:hypothetical protein